MRASLGATLAVLGAVGAVAAGSHAANAATPDTFTVVSAGATSGSPDVVTVVVDSPSTLTGLTASFVTSAAVDAYDQPLTLASSAPDPNDSTQTETTWTANVPAGASGLALGSGYSISLGGTFSDASTSSVASAGTFDFLATSAVTLNAASTSLSYGHASTTLSGQVTLTNPDATSDTDFSSLTTVTIQSGGTTIATLPLSSTGSFSDPGFTPSATESLEAVLAGTATVGGSTSSPALPLTVTSVTPSLTLKVNPVTETYGKAATVTGTLTYTSAKTPVAGQKVWVNTSNSSTGALATATTASTGSFSITLPQRTAGGTLYVGSASGTDLASVSAPLTLKVAHPTVISSFKPTLNQYWALSVSGCLGFPASDKTERITHTSGLTVEWAPPGGAWRKLGVINGNEADHACGTGGIAFSGSFTAPENYAYYRVVYAGTTGATSFAATNGNSVLAWRYADRITGFKVSPTTVNAGGKLTIKGTLQYYYSGWHNYGGQTIVIYLHPKGSNPPWYWLVKVKTNAKGQFVATFKDPVSATWQAVFEGNNSNGVGHLSYGSPEVYVRLK